ncbi:xylulokinase [Bacillus sp. OV322]|uniref:xylulokinase n=1 Tax=Bacillus sp. OV322 TaxID=1882764 RepID=UPI0008E557D8|nr:xylulokinase [Bacillus sp. OV322]SFC28536.1 xylulokinase [Bacillus sp. OV322]
MKYVIGVDLGTSSVKVVLVDQDGIVQHSATKQYPLIQPEPGYSEQDPEEWVEKTIQALKQLMDEGGANPRDIEGLSFSGQMHGLVLLDENHKVIRNAILWNDTRTTMQCREIEHKMGSRLMEITKNPALEGFTLPKLLWVKEHEPESFEKTDVFLLPKDYLRFRLTGTLHSEFSDASGTLLLDLENKAWSTDIIRTFELPADICPPLVNSDDHTGEILPEIASITGLSPEVKVFAGGADNACGAIGAGILSEGKALCSIGTSGVFLSYEENTATSYDGKVHLFNHGEKDACYSMGVTLSAGHSLTWFKNTFAENESFDGLIEKASASPIGANGLLFAPYLAGERTPHADAKIRGTFTGIDSTHKKNDFTRAVLEGIVFSINETVEIFRTKGKKIDIVVSTGGGAKNELWLQIQADIFNTKIIKLKSEQGPAMGAAMLAAAGLKWFSSLKECTERFTSSDAVYEPIPNNVLRYQELFQFYKNIYPHTASINHGLFDFKSNQ